MARSGIEDERYPASSTPAKKIHVSIFASTFKSAKIRLEQEM
jgi:hypothetical protein